MGRRESHRDYDRGPRVSLSKTPNPDPIARSQHPTVLLRKLDPALRSHE
jgi:hypothetical protein